MSRQRMLDGLHFNHDEILHKQIDPILRVQFDPLVQNRDGPLGDKPQLARRHFELHAGHVGGLEQARIQNPMDLDRGANDLTGDAIYSRIGQHASIGEQSAVLVESCEIGEMAFTGTQIVTTPERSSQAETKMNLEKFAPFLRSSL